MNTKHKSTIALAIFMATLSCGSSSLGAAPVDRPTATKKVKFGFTSLGIIQDLSGENYVDNKRMGGKRVGHARGEVTLPANTPLGLILDYPAAENPALLRAVPSDLLVALDCERMGPQDQFFKEVSRLTGLRRLYVSHAEASDESVAQLKTLTNLKHLTFIASEIRGSCFKDLEPLKNSLEYLRISTNTLAPDSFKYIGAFKKLTLLDLSRTTLTDKGFALIGPLPKLKTLRLGSNDDITGDTMKRVAQYKSLEALILVGTKLTVKDMLQLRGSHVKLVFVPQRKYAPGELDALRKALPGCRIAESQRAVDEQMNDLFAPLH